MNSTNRSRVKAGNVFALALSLAFACTAPGAAQTAGGDIFWFGGTRLIFDHAQLRDGQSSVGTDDAALAKFLGKLGAVLSYQPGQNYIVVTAADRRVVSFTLGSARFNVAGVDQSAGFAPYAQGDVAYLPFLDLARALFVDPIADGATTVLEPQIAALEVRPDTGRTLVTLRGAMPLAFRRTSAPADDDISLVFPGTASTLETLRRIDSAGLKTVAISVRGTPRNPTTTIDFTVAPGTARVLAPSDSPNSLTFAFAPPGTELGGSPIPAAGRAAAATASLSGDQSGAPAVPAAPAPSVAPPAADQGTTSVPAIGVPAPLETATPTAFGLAPATITALATQSVDGGFNVNLAFSGNVTYEFHRLGDNRWYVDFKPATLAVPTEDLPLDDTSVLSVRVKPFVGPVDHLATVRVALTLQSPRAVTLVPTANGLTIAVGAQDDPAAQTFGTGELLPGRLYTGIVPLPPPIAAPGETTAAEGWKFGRGVATNPRLIVIDPGHGGSDDGAMHNGLVEKDLNLDISKRLRAILLARGWEVKMTRETDVDVYAPNDSARDELQARDDVANAAGARMFVSIHTNSFTTSALNGTTTYYFKADSYPLAVAVHGHLSSALTTKDDGIRKENFYVIHHAAMPAILVETAFLSNGEDAALLKTSGFLQKVAGGIADGIDDYASGSQAPSTTGGSQADGS